MEKNIDGKKLQTKLKQELKEKIENLEKKLKLVVIQVGDNPASNVYIRNKKNLCEEMNILFEHIKYENISEENLILEIEQLNNDNNVTGILVQFPLPKEIDERKITEAIDPKKDVDGLTSQNLGKLFKKEETLIPCTALGIIKILKENQIDLTGKKVTIVGRSTLVGLPLIGLLLNENATVTICHSKTENLKEETKQADIVIVAIGKKEFITKEYIKEGAIVIDVGINRHEGKLYGDCDYNSIYDKCSYITPVPGGVGPLTVTMLVNNVYEAYKLQK